MSDMKNTTCKVCGSRYHFCSSCDSGGVEFMGDGYCSQTCYDTLTLVERLRMEGEDEAADEIERLTGILSHIRATGRLLAECDWER